MSAPPRILVVDDDRAVRTALHVNLTKAGMQVTLASDPAEALLSLESDVHDLMLTDVRMPGMTGIDLLEKVHATWPELSIVVMTGFGTVDDAVRAMRSGASDYLIKPVGKDELLIVLERALERRALRAEVALLRQEVTDRYGFEQLVGTSEPIQEVLRQVSAVADTNATVLLEGPTGTGKELLAHALHQRSRRREAAFVRIHCAAIPETLLESELFGHERGAFTGAVRQHLGRFEQADGGTLLLDEIGEIPPPVQVKLLRVLENGEFQRVGGTGTIRVDVRVIAATNRHLRDEVRAGRFREDLYYRLNVVRVRVPSLAERVEDIPLLAEHFVRQVCARNDRPPLRLSSTAIRQLQSYGWPGNARELLHLIERTVLLCADDQIRSVELPDELESDYPDDPTTTASLPAPHQPDEALSLPDALAMHERALIITALEAEDGVQARAAKRLGISRSNLHYRIQKLGITLQGVRYE